MIKQEQAERQKNQRAREGQGHRQSETTGGLRKLLQIYGQEGNLLTLERMFSIIPLRETSCVPEPRLHIHIPYFNNTIPL